jgi:adenosine kinase
MSVKAGTLFAYGNPLLDISAEVDEAFLKKYDLEANNAILADDKHKSMFEDMVANFTVEYVPGGATQNSIRVAQWMLQGSPHATTYTGCIGKDKYGEILEEKTQAVGTNTIYQYHESEPTGTSAVLVTDKGKNRSLVAYLAAANAFSKDHIDREENWALVQKARFYYMAGFPLTVSPPTMLKIAEHAAENDKTFCMNLSAPFLCQFFKDPLMQLFPYIDILFGNEAEAELFAKEQGFDTSDIKEIALKAAALSKKNDSRPRTVVFTQGSEPTVIAYNGKVQEYPIIPISAEELVDTNGAGDAFVGGYLAMLIQGKDVAECVRCANYAGNMIIQRSGCSLPEKPDFK